MMRTRPLQESLDRLAAEFPTSRALAGDLAADALFALAPAGLDDVLLELFTLASDSALGDRYVFEVFDLLVADDWQQWDMPAVQAILGWADAWWLTALRSPAEFADAGAALGQLVHLNVDMVRWLTTWLDELDGYGAEHLANFMIDGCDHAGWAGRADEMTQVRTWAASEKVVNGFTMVGGVHLEPGRLGALLDELIATPGLRQ